MKNNMKNIGDVLKSLVGHKVTMGFTQHEEPTLRTTTGILKEVNNEVIHFELCNLFGEKENYFLNRHACVLLSVIDEGTPK